MQALNEMLVKARKKMFGRSSEQVQYPQGEQISFHNEAGKDYVGGAKEPTEETLVKEHSRKKKRTKEELAKGLEYTKNGLRVGGKRAELLCVRHASSAPVKPKSAKQAPRCPS